MVAAPLRLPRLGELDWGPAINIALLELDMRLRELEATRPALGPRKPRWPLWAALMEMSA